jgi:Flp pilus assembly protein CpaB
MQRGRLLLILGVVLGLLTIGALAFLLLGGVGPPLFGGGGDPAETEPVVEPEPTGIPTTQVLVALQPIARGSEFVAGSIEAETIGKVAKTEIVQGQVIVRTMLVDKGVSGEAALNIPAGRVAIAYPINRQKSVAYAIQPGDSVDILITAFFV